MENIVAVAMVSRRLLMEENELVCIHFEHIFYLAISHEHYHKFFGLN